MAAAAHIAEVMIAVRDRIKSLESELSPPGINVEIGNPASFTSPTGTSAKHLVTLFLYRIEPDHAAYMASPDRGMTVKLKVMINVYGVKTTNSQESAATTELRILSEIMRLFLEETELGPIKVKGAPPVGAMTPFVTQGVMVEVQQLSLDMEEINHIWTTQGDTPFRTALIYSLNYGVVAPRAPSDEGPPVLRTEIAPMGGPSDALDMGIYPEMEEEQGNNKLIFTSLAIVEGSGTSAKLRPSLTLAPGGHVEPKLLLVAEEDAGTFDVTVEKLNTEDGTWVDVSPPQVGTPPGPAPREIDAVDRYSLSPSAPLPEGTGIRIENPSDGESYRLSVRHRGDPDKFRTGYVILSIKDGGGS